MGEGSQTVSRAMELLRLLACGQEQGVRLTDLVQMSGLNRPTVHRLLKTLIAEGVAEQDSVTRKYLIGHDIGLLGLARGKQTRIEKIAEPYLLELAEQTGDTVFLSIRNRQDSVCISRHTGHHPIQVLSIEVGIRRPLGIGVSGIALLSCLSIEESEKLISLNKTRLHALGDSEIRVRDRVEGARLHGYAYVERGLMQGTSAIAIPIQNNFETPTAAITITAMANRLNEKRLQEVLSLMQQQVLRLSNALI
jgi:DNA-binding IclR family transcriptional regulator